MTIDKDKLRALAEAATRGDWGQDGTYFAKARQEGGTTYVESWRPIGQAFSVEDAKFIAAANPATILALLGEIERLERESEQAKADGADAFGLAQGRADMIDQLKADNESLKGSCKAMGKDMAKVTRERNSARSKAEKLKAENEALRQSKERAIALVDQLEIQHAELKEAVKGLELDAERYRWLSKRERWAGVRADFDRGGVYREHRVTWHAGDCWPQVEGQSMDEAVDAAMAKEKGHD